MDKTFVDYFCESAHKYKEKVAVTDEFSSVTYSFLDKQSNALAHVIKDNYPSSDNYVAILLPREIAFVTSILATAKSGNCYVPININYPTERINSILEEVQPKLLITTSELWQKFNSHQPLKCSEKKVLLWDQSYSVQDYSPINLSAPKNHAVVFYTSGSTGKPLGVVHTHQSLMHLFHFTNNVCEGKPETRHACIADFMFISSISNLIFPLCNGASTFIINSKYTNEPQLLVDFLTKHAINRMFLPTGLGVLLINQYPNSPLHTLMLAGEGLKGINLSKIGDKKIFNVYGQTEGGVVTMHQITTSDLNEIPIGLPYHDTNVYILDENLNQVPEGEIGQLCYSSPGLAKGYLRNQERTSLKFIRSPFDSNQTMYLTGDMVRKNKSNELVYMGRQDHMIKINGYRIETEEVEKVSSRFNGITATVCVGQSVGNAQTLCLYYEADREIDKLKLKDFLACYLASYMIPSIYIQLDTMPRNERGKVNRFALPAPKTSDSIHVLPATETEQILFRIFSDVLGTTDFGVTTNLLTMGLSSLSAIQVGIKIQKQLGVYILMRKIIAQPTIRQIAHIIQKSKNQAIPEPFPVQEYYPLAANQLGIYLDWENNRDTTQYNIPMMVSWNRDFIDEKELKSAVIAGFGVHPVFTARVVEKEGEIMFHRSEESQVQIETRYSDRVLTDNDFQALVEPFNLINNDLYRIFILVDPSKIYLFVDVHHIIFDGLSSNVLENDIVNFFYGETVQAEKFTLFDNILHEEQLNQKSVAFTKAKDYFDSLLQGTTGIRYPYSQEITQGVLPVGHAYAEVDGFIIDYFCHQNVVTPSSFFATSVAECLHRITREEHIQFVTVENGRENHPDLSAAVGMFVKTLPMVSHRDTQTYQSSIDTCVLQMHQQLHHTYNYNYYPYHTLAHTYGLSADFMYVYQGDVYNSHTKRNFRFLHTNKAIAPISVFAYPDALQQKYILNIEYDAQLYSAADMQALADMIRAISQSMAVSTAWSEVCNMKAEVLVKTTTLSSGHKLPVNTDMTVTHHILQHAIKTPQSIAVVDETGTLSYQELMAYSNTLAHHIVNSGAQQGHIVALLLPRSRYFVESILGIHMAGCAYCPLDLEYPIDRLEYMLIDSEADILITTHREFSAKQEAGLNYKCIKQIVFIDELVPDNSLQIIDKTSPNLPAYMIYTSGSTGKPKGVLLHHRGLMNFSAALAEAENLTATDRISAHRSFSFDAHIGDFFPILMVGGQVHIMPSDIRKSLDDIKNYIVDHQITGCGFTTSITAMLLNLYPDLPIRFITAGGEKLQDVQNSHITIINEYGPTECTNDSTLYVIAPGTSVAKNIPIGRPVANMYCFVMDSTGHLLPPTFEGELCIAGPQVGLGYWKKPEQTAQVFTDIPTEISNILPQLSHEKLYHTGDIVCYNAEGLIEYVGRKDNQIKLHGFRIELGEIEQQAEKYAGITKAIACVKNVNGSNAICLYFIANNGIDNTKLQEHLKVNLAEYMMPSFYTQLDDFPRLPNGKISQKELPMPVVFNGKEEIILPETIDEQILFDAVKQVYQGQFGINTDLTALGISSIDMMRIVYTARKNGLENLTVGEAIQQKCIQNMVEIQQKQLFYWANEYNPNKPLVIFFCGIVPDITLLDIGKWFIDRYNVYVVGSLTDFFFKKKTICYEEYLNACVNHILIDLKDYRIDMITGPCLGAEIGMCVLERIQDLFPYSIRMLALDPFYDRQLMTHKLSDSSKTDAISIEIHRQSVLLYPQMYNPVKVSGPLLFMVPEKPVEQAFNPFMNIYEELTHSELEESIRLFNHNNEMWSQTYPNAHVVVGIGNHDEIGKGDQLVYAMKKVKDYWPDIEGNNR